MNSSRSTLTRPDRRPDDFHGILTGAPCMHALFRLMERVARSDASVLIRGDSGTGKELVAQALHNLGRRARGPFRAVNCATLTPELLASELFGHVRGAFTGAVRDRKGLFALADGGTIFLDEVAELPLDLQARLLRVLQERTFIPVGGTEHVEVDVRILSATHRSLRDEVERGRFREDLMYRIRVIPLYLPRLAERRDDVALLAWHFIDRLNQSSPRAIEGIERAAMDALLSYTWPGNIRELQNVIEYAMVVGEGPVLQLEDLTPELRGEPPPGSTGPGHTGDDAERRSILEALAATGGNRAEAARLLGISRTTLWRRLNESQPAAR